MRRKWRDGGGENSQSMVLTESVSIALHRMPHKSARTCTGQRAFENARGEQSPDSNVHPPRPVSSRARKSALHHTTHRRERCTAAAERGATQLPHRLGEDAPLVFWASVCLRVCSGLYVC